MNGVIFIIYVASIINMVFVLLQESVWVFKENMFLTSEEMDGLKNVAIFVWVGEYATKTFYQF